MSIRLLHVRSVLPGNTIFAEVVAGVSQDARPKVATFVDDGVIRETPDLLRRMQNFSEAYIALSSNWRRRFVVKGGERAENERRWLPSSSRGSSAWNLTAILCGGDRRRGDVARSRRLCRRNDDRGICYVRRSDGPCSRRTNSGIGVKNGVNAFGIKNSLGTFVPLVAVINDSAFIDVLPGRDKRAGDGRGRQGGARSAIAYLRDGPGDEGRGIGHLRLRASRPARSATRDLAHAPYRLRGRIRSSVAACAADFGRTGLAQAGSVVGL